MPVAVFVNPYLLRVGIPGSEIILQTLAQSEFRERIVTMEKSVSNSFTKLQPRPVSGWPLRLLFDLDAASPHFFAHVSTASVLKRQSIFAALVELQCNAGAVSVALGRASGVECSDPVARSARSLVLLKPAQLLRAIYGSVPDGLLGTLTRVGPDAFSRPGLYRDLFCIFGEPEERERADLIRQSPGTLTEERLEIAAHSRFSASPSAGV